MIEKDLPNDSLSYGSMGHFQIFSIFLLFFDQFFLQFASISYPESSGSLVSGVVARRDSGIMEFLSHESWDSGFIAHA